MNKNSFKIVLIYLIFGLLWITLSDNVLSVMVKDPDKYEMMQTYKGWFFVVCTAILLYVLTDIAIKNIEKLDNDLGIKDSFINQMFESNRTAVVLWDVDGTINRINPCFTEIFGYECEEVKGKNCAELLAANKDICKKRINSVLGKGNVVRTETSVFDKSGNKKIVEWNDNLLKENGKDPVIVSFGMDVTEKREYEDELRYLAYHDRLTGLKNRHKLENDLNDLIKRDRMFSLFYIDLCDFKQFNDAYDHKHGDLLLKKIAKELLNNYNEDIIYRWQGDEFIIISDFVEQSDIVFESEKVTKILNKKWKIKNSLVSNSVSVGIVSYPEHGENADELLKNADIAINRSIELSKPAIFDYSMQMEVEKFMIIKNSLEKAIESDEFNFNFQPIYDIETKKIGDLEVLLRWHSEEMGDISPIDFIDVAEKTNIIQEVDQWVIDHAFKFVKNNYEFLKDITLSINVSAKTFKSFEFVVFVEEKTKEYGLEPDKIKFEITEHSIVEDLNGALVIMNALKDLGFMTALDDFGTKYSSLNYLAKLPFDYIKIDKSYVDYITEDHKLRSVVKQLVHLAHDMGMKVIAEGIETIEQENMLLSLDCDYGQGYYFSRPVNEEKLFLLLNDRK
ncbi:MAG: EAL domain-containing protein [Bacillota bacterium]|nr:EAL domain-containing protein [Bacillota bacterium]